MKNLGIILTAGLFLWMTGVTFGAAAESADLPQCVTVPEPAAVIEQAISRPHPRILAVQDDFDRLKQQIPLDLDRKIWFERLKIEADAILDQPVCTYEIPDGKRLLEVSRKVKKRMLSLGMMWKLTEDPAYAERAAAEMMAAAAFPDWNPSHFLDVGELCFALGIGYDWCYDALDSTQRAVIKAAVQEKGIEPALEYMRGAKGFTQNLNNWNTVCCGGVGVGALAIAERTDLECGEAVAYAVQYMPKAIAEMAPDGGYPEGPAYWSYGTSYACYFMAAMETALGSDCGLSDIAGFSGTGYFPLVMESPGIGPFNYADSGMETIDAPHLYWLARRFQNPVFGWYQKRYAPKGGALDLLWYDSTLCKSPAAAGLELDRCFDGSEGVAVLRSSYEAADGVFAAIKAGDNQSSHGDLDVGSFVLDALGVRWAMELGAETYDIPGYWSMDENAGRWTYYRKRAQGHNTLVINPGMGPDQNVYAKDRILRWESGADQAFAIVSMDEAYSESVVSAKRGLRLTEGRLSVLVRDEVRCKSRSVIWWMMHTRAVVTLVEPRTAVLTQAGKQMRVSICSPADASFEAAAAEPLPGTPDPAEASDNAAVTRLQIRLNAKDADITVLFEPILESGDSCRPEDRMLSQPLDQWSLAGNEAYIDMDFSDGSAEVTVEKGGDTAKIRTGIQNSTETYRIEVGGPEQDQNTCTVWKRIAREIDTQKNAVDGYIRFRTDTGSGQSQIALLTETGERPIFVIEKGQLKSGELVLDLNESAGWHSGWFRCLGNTIELVLDGKQYVSEGVPIGTVQGISFGAVNRGSAAAVLELDQVWMASSGSFDLRRPAGAYYVPAAPDASQAALWLNRPVDPDSLSAAVLPAGVTIRAEAADPTRLLLEFTEPFVYGREYPVLLTDVRDMYGERLDRRLNLFTQAAYPYISDEFDQPDMGYNRLYYITPRLDGTLNSKTGTDLALVVDRAEPESYCQDRTRLYYGSGVGRKELVYHVPEGIRNFSLSVFDAQRKTDVQAELTFAVSADGETYQKVIPERRVNQEMLPEQNGFKVFDCSSAALPKDTRYLKIALDRREGADPAVSAWSPKLRCLEINLPDPEIVILGSEVIQKNGKVYLDFLTSNTTGAVQCGVFGGAQIGGGILRREYHTRREIPRGTSHLLLETPFAPAAEEGEWRMLAWDSFDTIRPFRRADNYEPEEGRK